jgi:thymidylate synthase (FAD)
MKIIKPSFEIWDQEEGLEGMQTHIERCGRVCYASEPKGNPVEFVQRMVNSGHGAMLEHGTVYLKAKTTIHGGMGSETIECPLYKYSKNPYSVVKEDYEGFPDYLYVTTNFRVLVENGWLCDLKYICEPTKYHEKRVTVHFTTQIAITREYNRHRVNSMAEQSTRYCNYGKDKFGGVGINLPSWVDEEELTEEKLKYQTNIVIPNDEFGTLYERETYLWGAIDWWLWANACAELAYLNLLRLGWTPQQARVVLPLDTNTELIHTAFVSDWEHFFGLRDDSHAHPDARLLAHPLHEIFKERNLIV